jgi:hypothetical protein
MSAENFTDKLTSSNDLSIMDKNIGFYVRYFEAIKAILANLNFGFAC